MLYGASYEGRSRECDNCGHFTNVHDTCGVCETAVCEGCEDDHACVCEHLSIRIEDHEDPDGECARIFEEITCRDCGAELIERKGELVARRAA